MERLLPHQLEFLLDVLHLLDEEVVHLAGLSMINPVEVKLLLAKCLNETVSKYGNMSSGVSSKQTFPAKYRFFDLLQTPCFDTIMW